MNKLFRISIMASAVALCLVRSTAQIFGFSANIPSDNQSSFYFHDGQRTFSLPIPSVIGSFTGSLTINPATGKVSVSGTVSQSAGNVSQTFTDSLTTSSFVKNPFPLPGGHTVITTIAVDVLEVSASYGAFSQSFSETEIAPVYLSGDFYQVPLAFTQSLPISLTYTLKENGSIVASDTLIYTRGISLGAIVDVAGYPSSVAILSTVNESANFKRLFQADAPSGLSWVATSVPEPAEYMTFFGAACVGAGALLRRNRKPATP